MMSPGERTLLRITTGTLAEVDTARLQFQIAFPTRLAGSVFDASVRNLIARSLIRRDLKGSRLIPTTAGREALEAELRAEEAALRELGKQPV